MVDPSPFDELIGKLRDAGLTGEADSLSRLMGSAWTTSSEMMGELGLAILRLQQKSPLSAELEQLARRCMGEVRKVWPDIKLP